MPFDYIEELLSNPNNQELRLERRQPTESATGKNHPNTSNELSSSNANVAQNGDSVKYSISDSNGRRLTTEQQEHCKDSKIRDENGNLKVMYHGTPNGDFTNPGFMRSARNPYGFLALYIQKMLLKFMQIDPDMFLVGIDCVICVIHNYW